MIKKIVKLVVIIPLYIFLLLEGFIGGLDNKDIWDDLMKWVNR